MYIQVVLQALEIALKSYKICAAAEYNLELQTMHFASPKNIELVYKYDLCYCSLNTISTQALNLDTVDDYYLKLL